LRVVLCLVAVLASAALVALPVAGKEDKAPNFTLEKMEGGRMSLKDILKNNKAVIVDFWDTTCVPCNELLPHIQRMHEAYSEKGLKVVIVSEDTSLTIQDVKPFITSRKYTFQVLLDPTHEVANRFGAKGYTPFVFVLDGDGRVAYRHKGYRAGDEKDIEKAVRDLLGIKDETVAKDDASGKEGGGGEAPKGR